MQNPLQHLLDLPQDHFGLHIADAEAAPAAAGDGLILRVWPDTASDKLERGLIE
jgi:hypothetical protein